MELSAGGTFTDLDVNVEHRVAAELNLHVHGASSLGEESQIVGGIAIVTEPALRIRDASATAQQHEQKCWRKTAPGSHHPCSCG